MARKITSIRPLLEKARQCKVQRTSMRDVYDVISSTSGENYRVDLRLFTCTCPRQTYIGPANGFVNSCSHVQAAFIYKQLRAGYWLVARAESEDVCNLKRKAVHFAKVGKLDADGVKFTARKINPERARQALERMEG